MRSRQDLAERLADEMGQDLPIRERAVDRRTHRAEVLLADSRADRRACKLAIRQREPVLRRGDHHAFQKLGADLMAEPARPAVDHHDDVALPDAEDVGDRRVEDRGDLLHFEVVIAAPERAHLRVLTRLRARRHATGFGVSHLAVLFDSLEVLTSAPTPRHRSLRAA